MKITHNTPPGSVSSGPYTPSVTVSGVESTLFVSGQGPVDPQTGKKYLGEDIAKQIRITLGNLKQVVESSGFALKNVVKVTVFVKNIDHMAILNPIYEEYFTAPWPSRSTVEVSNLPSGQAIEIEAVAVA